MVTAQQATDADLIRAGACPWCTRMGLRNPAIHISKAHGIDKRELRETLGVPWSAPLAAPDVLANLAELSKERRGADAMQGKPRNTTSKSEAGRKASGLGADANAAARRKIPVAALDAILARRANGDLLREIAADYGCTVSALSMFIHARTEQAGPMSEISALTAARSELAAELAVLTDGWRAAIKAALAAGSTRTDIGAAAGISRQRVVQIEEGRWR